MKDNLLFFFFFLLKQINKYQHVRVCYCLKCYEKLIPDWHWRQLLQATEPIVA